MGRGSAKGSPPKKKPGKKASAKRRAAPKRVAKTVRSSAKPDAKKLAGELKAAQARLAATSEILRVISQSPADAQPVFETIVMTAARLLRSDSAFIMRCDGLTYSHVAAATRYGLRPVINPAPRTVDPDADFPSRAIATGKDLYLPDWSAIDLPAFERMRPREA